jgi:glycosyl transferase, family 25
MKAAIPVFVVSLMGSPWRSRISEQLRRSGIAFEFVDAVDGGSLTPTELAQHYDESASIARIGRPMGRNEIGCALSHRLIYGRMLEQRLPSAVILEDDAEIRTDFADIWQRLHRVPDNVELLSLCSAHGFVNRRPEARIGDFGLHRAASPLSLTVGYFIRQSAAKILSEASRVGGVADWPVDHGTVRQYLAIPMPIDHPPRPSPLAGERALLQSGKVGRPPVRVLRALLFLTFLPFVLGHAKYASIQNYVDRQVSWRLLRHLSPFFIDVAKLPRQINAPEL